MTEQYILLCRVVVAGFSQGGAVALLMLRSDLKLAGVAGLSTWLTMADEELLSAANKDTPLWMAHGTADPMVCNPAVLRHPGISESLSAFGHCAQVLSFVYIIMQVRYEYGARSADALKAAGADISFNSYKGALRCAQPFVLLILPRSSNQLRRCTIHSTEDVDVMGRNGAFCCPRRARCVPEVASNSAEMKAMQLSAVDAISSVASNAQDSSCPC